MQDHVKSLEKELAALKSKLAAGQGDELVTQAVDVNGIKVLAATLDGADVARLRETMDKLKDKLKTAAIVLASVADGKVSLIAGVTADATGKVKAGMSWSTLWPSRWAARAADVPIWRKRWHRSERPASRAARRGSLGRPAQRVNTTTSSSRRRGPIAR
ncbi:DHHA1 domain-containing protein [Massilia sp. B-10]|nr:DHHA1 domain-containing protein [Massilia sp. B-10]